MRPLRDLAAKAGGAAIMQPISAPSPIRVLHLVRPATGGIRQHVVNLIRFMPADEVTPSIAAPEDLLANLPVDLASATRTLLDIRPGFSPVRDLIAAFKLANLVRDDREVLAPLSVRGEGL